MCSPCFDNSSSLGGRRYQVHFFFDGLMMSSLVYLAFEKTITNVLWLDTIWK